MTLDKSLLLVAALALPGAALATPTVSGDGACGIRAVDNESFVTCDGDRAPAPAPESADDTLPTAFVISARQAVQIKADLGSRALLADIRDYAPGPRLLDRLDGALVAHGLGHGDAVIVLVRSREHGRLATALMGEHGYHQVFVVPESGEEQLASTRPAP